MARVLKIQNPPDWLASLPDDAMLNAKEVHKLFGVIHSHNNVTQSIARGHIPPSTKMMHGHTHRRRTTHRWSVKDLKKYIKGVD